MSLILGFVFFFSAGLCAGQSLIEPPKKLRDPNFEFVLYDYLDVESRSSGSRTLFMVVYVKPKYATEDKIQAFTQKIKVELPLESRLSAIFFVDRQIAGKFFGDNTIDENEVLKVIRGVYFLSRGENAKEVAKHFPKGVTPEDVEMLGQVKQN